MQPIDGRQVLVDCEYGLFGGHLGQAVLELGHEEVRQDLAELAQEARTHLVLALHCCRQLLECLEEPSVEVPPARDLAYRLLVGLSNHGDIGEISIVSIQLLHIAVRDLVYPRLELGELGDDGEELSDEGLHFPLKLVLGQPSVPSSA